MQNAIAKAMMMDTQNPKHHRGLFRFQPPDP